MSVVAKNILNENIISPRSLAQYSLYRGITDFTNTEQFNMYEGGRQFLSIISIPKFLDKLADEDNSLRTMIDSFVRKLEYEFKGLDGLPDLNSDTYEISDGVNTQRFINKVTRDTAITVSSRYYETSGSLITKVSNLYLTGISDPNSTAKTYHGLIKNGKLAPGLENEVFTMLYYATDATFLRIEKAVLLANCQLTKAEESIYNGQKGELENKELTVEFNCFPITGYEVDKAAKSMLEDITGVNYNPSIAGAGAYSVKTTKNVASLDTYEHKYGIFTNDSDPSAVKLQSLIQD